MSAGLALHGFPGSCSLVVQAALAQADAAYDYVLVRIDRGEHVRPNFRAINPWAKVPVLRAGTAHIAEIPAILRYLCGMAPDAEIMPRPRDPCDEARAWSVLSWCSSTLHPMITRVRRPDSIAGPEAAAMVYEAAAKHLVRHWTYAEGLLTTHDWMLGERWSAVDAYLLFCRFKCLQAGFDMARWPALADHAERTAAWPAVAAALTEEGAIARANDIAYS